MRVLIYPAVLLFLFLSSCSVYRSQGRRDFETATPQRVPISVVFQCHNTSSAQRTTETVELKNLKERHPDLIIRENISDQTVVLLASREGSSTVCISEGLDLSEYTRNLEI